MPQRTDRDPPNPPDEAPETLPAEPQPQATDDTPSSHHPDDTQHLTVDHVFKTIRLMLTLFSVLFATLLLAIGFVGWRTASNIESNIDETIATTVDRRLGSVIEGESDELATLSNSYSMLIAEFRNVREDVLELAGDVAIARETLELFLAGEVDPVGEFYGLLATVEPRSALVQSSVLFQPELRKQAELVFRKLLSVHNAQRTEVDSSEQQDSDRHVDAEVLFNAAGLASEFQMPKLASELAKAAWEKHDTPEHKARMYRAMIATGEADEASALREVYKLLETLDTPHQLHLVLSEVFNVAFVSGGLSGLVEVLEQFKSRYEERAPSYVWILQASSLLLQGATADAQRAIVELRAGLEKASQESPMALWFEESIEQSKELLQSLERHPFFRQAVADIRSDFESLLAIEPADEEDGAGRLGSPTTLEELVEVLLPAPPDSGLIEIPLDDARIVERPSWNWFSFTAESDGHYSVTATAGNADVDPEVVVWNSDREFLGGDDDSGGGWDSQLIIWLSRGAYTIGVGPALGETVEGTTLAVTRYE